MGQLKEVNFGVKHVVIEPTLGGPISKKGPRPKVIDYEPPWEHNPTSCGMCGQRVYVRMVLALCDHCLKATSRNEDYRLRKQRERGRVKLVEVKEWDEDGDIDGAETD